jgi:aminoglycoside phosphotransferase (APT) family kinase protein
LVREFPFDGRLRSLQVLRDEETQARFIRRLFPEQSNAGAATLQVLAYKPERRFVAKLSGIKSGDVVLKFYGLHAFNRSFTNLRHLRRIDYSLMPSLVAKSTRRRVLALAWHPGRIFREHLSDGRVCQEIAVKIGNSLASLHEQPTDNTLLEWSLPQELERLQELTDTLSFLVPRLAPQAQHLCDAISSQLKKATATKQLVHADFHSKQVLVHDNDVRFLDADELAVGPAQLDVGTFIAHLHRDGLCGRIPLALVGQTADDFLEGYRAAGGSTESAHAYVALALLKFSHHPFRACEADWDQQVEKIVQLASQFVTADGSKGTGERKS